MLESANQKIDKLAIDELLDLHNGSTGPQIKLRIQNKTADYTVTVQDSGTVFTNVGDADDINYTLPATPIDGFFAIFVQATDNELKVTAETADTLVTYNDLTADSVAFTTASEQIGTALMVVASGGKFVAFPLSNGTFTVGT